MRPPWKWRFRPATQQGTPTRKVGWRPEETVVGVVAAHPDDWEAFAGGTLVQLAGIGIPVHILIVTGGEASWAGRPTKVARVRLSEARAAAATIGATSFHTLARTRWWALARSWRDAHVHNSLELQLEIVAWARQHRVNLLMTGSGNCYHSDHRQVSDAVTDARLKCDVPNVGRTSWWSWLMPRLRARRTPLPRTPDLAYWDSQYGSGFEPDVWFNVTATIGIRRQAIDCHKSQAILPDGRSLRDVTDTLARLRGDEALYPFAEAFRGSGPPAPDGGIRRLVHLLDR
jgi:LmbE family N-acetylglucosaminyl deacetylase